MIFHRQILWLLVVVLLQAQLLRAASEISKRCESLKTHKLRRICLGFYPEEIALKYQDALIGIGERYAIFRFDDEDNRYFISFKKSPLNLCSLINVVNRTYFECLDEGTDGKGYVPLPGGILACLNMQYELLDDLLYICQGRKSSKPNAPSVFVALHYGYRSVGGRGLSSSTQLQIPIYLAYLVGIVIYI